MSQEFKYKTKEELMQMDWAKLTLEEKVIRSNMARNENMSLEEAIELLDMCPF